MRYLERSPSEALPYALPQTLTPLVGGWPVPGCGLYETPLDVDATLATGRTLREYFVDFAAQLAGTFPVVASWIDGSQTELLVELAGEPELACLQNTGLLDYVLSTRLHVATADARLDTLQSAKFELTLREKGPTWTFRIESDAMDVSSLRALTGLRSTALDGDSEAMFALTGWLERGDLQAWGYSDQRHTRDYLFWCLSDDCSPYPRPSFTN